MRDIPLAPEEIDAAWLEAALAERHPGVRVRSVEIVRRQQWTNAHAWLRVHYHEPTPAPEMLFCKLLPADEPRREAIVGTGMGLREARFYRDLAPALDLRVPQPHVVRCDPESGDFVLLLEDLEGGGCGISAGPEGIAAAASRRAVEDLAELHVRFERQADRAGRADWVCLPPAQTAYGASMLQYGLDHHRDRLSNAFAELAALYIERGGDLHGLWSQGPGPRTVLHGDAHIGNLFQDRGRVGFLDWGMLQLGQPLRDIGYFLVMALEPETRRQLERELIRHYLRQREALGGEPIHFDDAWLAYRLCASYTVVACCQVVTFPADATERRRVFAQSLLERAQAAVEDLDVRGALRLYAGL